MNVPGRKRDVAWHYSLLKLEMEFYGNKSCSYCLVILLLASPPARVRERGE